MSYRVVYGFCPVTGGAKVFLFWEVKKMQVEIMDTTLRDGGEQTPGVSFTVDEKLSMAKCYSKK